MTQRMERFIYLSIAVVLAGASALFALWMHGNYIELASQGGFDQWIRQPGTLILIAFSATLALLAGAASLLFLLMVWTVESPEDILNDAHWCELLFREHPKRQLREWARSMRYFRFIRGPGGGMTDHGDRLAVLLRAESPLEVDRAFAALGVPERTASASPVPNRIQVEGVDVSVYHANGRLELSITDSRQPYAVTQAAVDAARSVELLLERLAGMLVEPPQDDRHCVCPRYYPSFWQKEGRKLEEIPAAGSSTAGERRQNQAVLLGSLGVMLLFLAIMAWRQLEASHGVPMESANPVFGSLHDIGGIPLATGIFLIPGLLFLFLARRILRNLKREKRRMRRKSSRRNA